MLSFNHLDMIYSFRSQRLAKTVQIASHGALVALKAVERSEDNYRLLANVLHSGPTAMNLLTFRIPRIVCRGHARVRLMAECQRCLCNGSRKIGAFLRRLLAGVANAERKQSNYLRLVPQRPTKPVCVVFCR